MPVPRIVYESIEMLYGKTYARTFFRPISVTR